jgi:hypothetical protein
MKKISLKEQNKKKITQDTLFSKQYQRISEQLNAIMIHAANISGIMLLFHVVVTKTYMYKDNF